MVQLLQNLCKYGSQTRCNGNKLIKCYRCAKSIPAKILTRHISSCLNLMAELIDDEKVMDESNCNICGNIKYAGRIHICTKALVQIRLKNCPFFDIKRYLNNKLNFLQKTGHKNNFSDFYQRNGIKISLGNTYSATIC